MNFCSTLILIYSQTRKFPQKISIFQYPPSSRDACIEKSAVTRGDQKVQVNFCEVWIFQKSKIRPNKREIVSWSWMLTKCYQISSKGSSEYVQSTILLPFLWKKLFWISKSCCQKTCFQLADFLLFWENQKCFKNASTTHL